MTKEEAIKFYNYLRKDEDIINFDTQGWPCRKASLITILDSLGFGTYEVNGEKIYGINSDSEILKIFPTTLEDDGMGYGVNEKYIIEATTNDDTDSKTYCHFFVESELENKDIWYDNYVLPGTVIEYEGHDVLLFRAKEESGKKWFGGRYYENNNMFLINIPEEYVKEYVDKNMFEDE